MTKSIFKNTIFKFFLNLFNVIVPLLIGPYVVRTLGPDLTGTINFAQSLYSYFFIFASFGIFQYGVREISKIRDNNKKLNSLFTSLFILTSITSLITLCIYFIFIYFKYQNVSYYYIYIMLSINFFSNIFYIEWANEGLENYDFITIKTIIVKVIYIILLISLVKSSNDYKVYIILLILSTFLNNISSFFYVKKIIKFTRIDISILKHIKPMFYVVILANSYVFYTQLDKIIIGEYLDKRIVAYYVMSQNIMLIVNGLIISVMQVTLPRLSNFIENKNNIEYFRLLDKITSIFSLLIFPAAIGMFTLSKEIILLYGGKSYIEAYPIFRVFCIYMIVIGFESILTNQILYLMRQEANTIKMIFICGILNLLMKIILISTSELTGVSAIITTLVSDTMLVSVQYFYIRYKLSLDFKLFNFNNLKYLLISIIFIPITYFIKLFTVNILIICILTIIINGLFYVLILLLIRDITFIKLIEKIKEKIGIRY